MDVMDELLKCAVAFEQLLSTEYYIIIGRKGKRVSITIKFDKKDFHHLIGLQKLTDLAYLKSDRGRIFDKILAGSITLNDIRKSSFFDMIFKRINYFSYIESLLDSNRLIFKYNKNSNPYSEIEAEYVLKNQIFNNDVYIFIDKEMEDSDKYFCRSFFPKETMDYTKNQANYTLLYKEKINLITKNKTVQYDKLTPKEKLVAARTE